MVIVDQPHTYWMIWSVYKYWSLQGFLYFPVSVCSSVVPTSFFVRLKPIPLVPFSTCPWKKPLSSSQGWVCPVSEKILLHYTSLLVKRVTLSYRWDAADLCEFILQWLHRVPAVHMKSLLGNHWNSEFINLSQPGHRKISLIPLICSSCAALTAGIKME